MDHLQQLLIDLESVTLKDISEIPTDKQHEVVEHIEALQDRLREISRHRDKSVLEN